VGASRGALRLPPLRPGAAAAVGVAPAVFGAAGGAAAPAFLMNGERARVILIGSFIVPAPAHAAFEPNPETSL
jgi:hypothetical protein